MFPPLGQNTAVIFFRLFNAEVFLFGNVKYLSPEHSYSSPPHKGRKFTTLWRKWILKQTEACSPLPTIIRLRWCPIIIFESSKNKIYCWKANSDTMKIENMARFLLEQICKKYPTRVNLDLKGFVLGWECGKCMNFIVIVIGKKSFV